MRKMIFCALSVVLAAVLALSSVGCGGKITLPEGDTFEFTRSQLMGTDDLGRQVLPNGGNQKNKYVGLCYLTLISEVSGLDKIYNVTDLLEEYGSLEDWVAKHGESEESVEEYYTTHPLFNRDPDNTVAPNSKHFWIDEPLYGYYSNCDPWVIYRQLMLFGYMDVDYILLDLSNYPFYFVDANTAVLDAVAAMTDAGYKVPKVAFMFPQNPLYCNEMLQGAWNYFIRKVKYEDIWFRGDASINPSGAPMMCGAWDAVDEFSWEKKVWLKGLQWPNTDVVDDDAIPWMDWNDRQRNHNGCMNVSVAQHVASWSSKAYLYRNDGAGYHGRGWTYDDPTTGYDPEKVMAGANFEQQWDWAISQGDEVYMVLIREWNEWTARKLGLEEPGAETSPFAPLVDEFDYTYSRSVEMMDGGYGDNFVMQMARKIREFKSGTTGDVKYVAKNQRTSISISDLSSWDSVENVYQDYSGFLMERDFRTGSYPDVDPDNPSYRGYYRDTTNRNDVDLLQIANDGDYLYVNVACAEEITKHGTGDRNWMNLYLSTGNSNGWENYNYLVNADPEENGRTTVHKLSADASGAKVLGESSSADYFVSGKNIVFRIRLSDLGASKDSIIQVKASDNVGGAGAFKVCNNAWDFYLTGDCAPAGRFNYAYRAA